MGVVSPLALTAEETWAKVTRGESGIGPITLFDTAGWPVRIAGGDLVMFPRGDPHVPTTLRDLLVFSPSAGL